MREIYKTLCIIFALSMAALPTSATAQVQGVIDRSYSYVSIGGQAYQNDANRLFKHMGFQGEVGLGANMFDVMGMRIGLGAGRNTNTADIASNYLGIHFDLTFNLSKVFYGKDAQRRSSLQAIVGAGLIHRLATYQQVADNDIMIIPGLKYTTPLGNGIYLLIEGKAMLFTRQFDENNNFSAKFMLNAGIEHRFNDNIYRNGIHSGTNSSWANWHATLSAGVNSLQYAGLQSSDRMRLMKPAVELSVGKFLGPILGIRMGVLGISAATTDKEFNILNAHVEMTLNLMNMKAPRQNRPFNFSLYGGVGLIDRFDTRSLTPNINAGALGRFWLTKRSDLTADLRYMMTMTRFLSDMPNQGRTSVGMLSLMIGYTYNITGGDLR